MYDKTSLRILEQIYLSPGVHKRGLSKQLKLSMPSIDNAFKKIEKFFKKQKSGNQIKYSLDYSKQALTPALYAVEYSRFENLPSNIKIAVNDFIKELEEKPLIVILFGSYAKNTYTKNSDIDILVVFQKVCNEGGIENTAKKISMRAGASLNPVYLDYHLFKESFHNPMKDFFKNLKKNKLILVGIEWWRQLEDEES